MAEDDVGQLVVRAAVDELERGLAALRIHPHVDGPLATEAHAAIGVVELGRADSEIGHQPVDLRDAAIGELLEHAREGGMDEAHAVGDGGQAGLGGGDGAPVAVDGDDARLRFGLEQGDGVAAAAEGRVDVDAAGAGCEGGDQLLAHHGGVLVALHVGDLFEVVAPHPLDRVGQDTGERELETIHSPSSARRDEDVATLVFGGLEVVRPLLAIPGARRNAPDPAHT